MRGALWCIATAAIIFIPFTTYSGCGLIQGGNTCFLAAAMQMLYTMKSFNNGLLEIKNEDKIDDNTVLGQYLKKINTMQTTKENAIEISDFENFFNKNAYQEPLKNLGTGAQQDPDEFLSLFLEEITIKAATSGKKQTKVSDRYWNILTFINNNFQLYMASNITCDSCKTEGVKKDPLPKINLEISNTKNDDLVDILKEAYGEKSEKLTGENKVYCKNCTKNTPTTKTNYIVGSPKFFIVTLKRTVKETSYKYINKKITFPLINFDLTEITKNTKEKVFYNLIAIVCHSGNIYSTTGKSYGHYYGYFKNPEKNSWFYANDSTYTQKDNSDIEKIATQKNETGHPYMLVYQKIDPLQTALALLKAKLLSLAKTLKS